MKIVGNSIKPTEVSFGKRHCKLHVYLRQHCEIQERALAKKWGGSYTLKHSKCKKDKNKNVLKTLKTVET